MSVAYERGNSNLREGVETIGSAMRLRFVTDNGVPQASADNLAEVFSLDGTLEAHTNGNDDNQISLICRDYSEQAAADVAIGLGVVRAQKRAERARSIIEVRKNLEKANSVDHQPKLQEDTPDIVKTLTAAMQVVDVIYMEDIQNGVDPLTALRKKQEARRTAIREDEASSTSIYGVGCPEPGVFSSQRKKSRTLPFRLEMRAYRDHFVQIVARDTVRALDSVRAAFFRESVKST